VSNKALGKGLEALFQTSGRFEKTENFSADGSGRTSLGYFVDIAKVVANPDQPRKEFDDALLNELADSVKEKGILQPILVEKKDDVFMIIAGERRYRAAIKAGLKEIPVIEKNFDEKEKLEIALIENIQRENLSPIEEAKAFLVLINNYKLGQDELSKRVGKNRSTIANSLRLLKMPEDMQESLSLGKITAGHARALLSVVNPADQRILFNRIVADDLSVRETEKQAAGLNKGIRSVSDDKDKSQAKKKSPDVVDIEQKFIDVLGTKVALNGTLQKGKIEITYFSKEDLERIFDIIAK
jgi:ParB family chromosome partitioning protein